MKVLGALVLFTVINVHANEFTVKTKEVLKRELKSRALSLDEWVEKTNEEDFDLLCFGESHTNFFRDFYAEKVFSKLNVNTLALEALEEPVMLIYENYVEKREGGQNTITGVDISPVLNKVFSLNPEVALVGVERTRVEAGLITKAQLAQFGSTKSDTIINRETFIASHLDGLLKEGEERIAVLYGSSHCAKLTVDNFGYTAPFYRLLLNKYGASKKMKSVHVIKKDERENVLRLYASDFGMLDEDVVIQNPGEIDPKDYNYSLGLMSIFKTYDAIILESK